MPQHSLYRLEHIADNPAYEGFVSTEEDYDTPAGLTPTGMRVLEGKQYKPRRLLPTWKPVKVVGRVRKFNDYPAGDLVPIFSAPAVIALRDFLEPNGELLPLDSKLGTYFAYNLITSADVLDHARSKIGWIAKPFTATTIDHYEVIPEKLHGLTIFQLPYMTGEPLVTDPFVERVKQRELKGMRFTKLWPLPPGMNWWDMAKLERKKEAEEGLPPGKSIKGNTVVIRLYYHDRTRTQPNAEEERRIKHVMEDLNGRLVDITSTGPVMGSLEGRDDVNGETRLFLTCPDADALVEHLRPWLRAFRWPEGIRVLKRYGEFVDEDVPETYVEDI